jgi:acetyl-CoA acetyltransferase/uncharacterized OB-fold protein
VSGQSSQEEIVRPLPQLTPVNEWFWTSGADGHLRIQGCDDCGQLVHPPTPLCPACGSRAWSPTVVSGRATVVGFTVNQQQWLPAFEPPYAIANVALAEDDTVHLTTNVVGCEPDDVHIGQEVAVRFEHQDDVWLPLFEATGRTDSTDHVAEPERPRPRPPASSERFEHRVVLSGVGRSAIGRRLMVDPLSLTVDACQAAVADAGLTLGDIDGLSTYPGAAGGGISEGGITAVEEALRLRPTWINGGGELPGPGGAVIQAMLAVAAGLCRHVLCFRTVWESTAAVLRLGGMGGRVSGPLWEWRAPFGAMSAANWIGMNANQYLHRYGATREMLGWIAINGRANAARNPLAIYRDPMTMDDYLSARPITSPFGLYDCDVPCDASVAVVVSDASVAPDLPKPPIRVEAVGTQIIERVSWDQGTLTHSPRSSASPRTCGREPVCVPSTSTSRSSTTASRSTPSRGSKHSASATSARRWTGSTAGGASRSTETCRSTRTAGSSPRDAPTASASSPRPSRSSAAKPANGRSPVRGPPWSPPAAAHPRVCCSCAPTAPRRTGRHHLRRRGAP